MSITRVLIIGGYGNFGSFIARMLGRENNIQLIIAGRNQEKAEKYIKTLQTARPAETALVDIHHHLASSLATIKPDIVIHTSGPYQGQGYDVAKACIAQQCHYIDLADARDFVTGISVLNDEAKKNNVLICSGASSVPCLTGGIIDHFKDRFKTLEKIEYAIATAHMTNRGLATTSAVLSYAGKPFTTLINGKMTKIYGWMGLKFKRFWKLNMRPLSNCDIPDLAIFPQRYPSLHTIRFRAGLELKLLHFILISLASLVRIRLLPSLQPLARILLKISFLFDPFGKDNSGFYMTLSGKNASEKPIEITFHIAAQDGDGLYIPSMAAILMAKKLADGKITKTGATACLDLITLEEYLEGLSEFHIQWQETEVQGQD